MSAKAALLVFVLLGGWIATSGPNWIHAQTPPDLPDTYLSEDERVLIDHPADWEVTEYTSLAINATPQYIFTAPDGNYTVGLMLVERGYFPDFNTSITNTRDLAQGIEMIRPYLVEAAYGENPPFTQSAPENTLLADRAYAEIVTTGFDATSERMTAFGLLYLNANTLVFVQSTLWGEIDTVAFEDWHTSGLAIAASLRQTVPFDPTLEGNMEVMDADDFTEIFSDNFGWVTVRHLEGWEIDLSFASDQQSGVFTFSSGPTANPYVMTLHLDTQSDLVAAPDDDFLAAWADYLVAAAPTITQYLSGVLTFDFENGTYQEVLFVTADRPAVVGAFGLFTLSDGRVYAVSAEMPLARDGDPTGFYFFHAEARAILSTLFVQNFFGDDENPS